MTGELAMLFCGLAAGFILGVPAGTVTGIAIARSAPTKGIKPDED